MKQPANQRRRWMISWSGYRAVSVGVLIAMLAGTAARGLGAAPAPLPPPNNNFHPALNTSTYQTLAARDPFLKPGENLVPTGPKTIDQKTFHLDGFLGATNDLTAIVNGWVLRLNKPVAIETATGRIQIKAVQITLEGVVLEVGGQLMKLQRDIASAPMKPLK